MTIKELTETLDNHGINYTVINGKVMAESSYTINCIPYTEIVNLTDMLRKDLYDWLGY